MVARLRGGYRPVLRVDDEGHREYLQKFLVECETNEGPLTALSATGLPATGAMWSLGVEADPWAWCRPETQVLPHVVEDSVGEYYIVERLFSSRPLERCGTANISNPLLEPAEIGGTIRKVNEEATRDLFGRPIVYSSWEQIRGPQVEFESSQQTIKITKNIPVLQLPLWAALVDGLNHAPLWGFPARTVRFSSYSWERKFYGQCLRYYRVSFEFDTDLRGFDRFILDEGTAALHGSWKLELLENGDEVTRWVVLPIGRDASGSDIMPNPQNPAHFVRLTDKNGNPKKVTLNGAGVPFDPFPVTTTACSVCDEAPDQWVLSAGFDPGNLDAVLGVGNHGFRYTLEHSSGCVWTSGNGPAIWQLSADLAVDNWYVVNPSGVTWYFRRPFNQADTAKVWDCLGDNVLHQATPSESSDWPESVTVSAVTSDSQPGTIVVRKYPSVNLLALGIPGVLI